MISLQTHVAAVVDEALMTSGRAAGGLAGVEPRLLLLIGDDARGEGQQRPSRGLSSGHSPCSPSK